MWVLALRARMNCCEFRDKYSDYADGLLPAEEAREARAHLDACPPCRRFDGVFRTGVAALRSVPAVGMSRTFGPRLRERLRREISVRVPVVARWSGAMGTLLLVATVGVVGLDLVRAHPRRHDTLPLGPAAVAVPLVPPAAEPAAFTARFDSTVIPLDALHPLEPVLIESVLAAAAAPAAAVGGDRPPYDLSVVWGGQ